MEPADSSPPLRDTPEQDPSEDLSQKRVSAYDPMVVETDLEKSARKKDEMKNIYSQIQDKASSVLELTLRWEEIDEQFGFLEQRTMEADMKEKLVMERSVELENKEVRLRLAELRERNTGASITERLNALEEKEFESDLKLFLEANVMGLFLQMQNEQVVVAQLNAQEKVLGLLQNSMMKKHGEVMRDLEARKEEVAFLSKSIDEKSCDLEMKVRDFDLKQTAEDDRRRKEAENMETSLKQLEARKNELSLLNNAIKDKATELEKKEEHFQLKQQAEAKEFEWKSKLFELKEKKLAEREKQLKLKQRSLEERSIQVETRKRSRLGHLSAEKGIDADSRTFPGKRVRHGKASSAFATETERTSEVKRREANEDSEPFTCPDPDFNDFNNTMSSFAVDQVWALYDPIDDMPRYYARIKGILTPQLSLRVQWLESVQTTENEEPGPACGSFKYGNLEEKSHLMFSHEVHHIKRGKSVTIYPRKGETWALLRDWSKTRNSHRGQQKPPYRYDFVEVLSEFDSDQGIGVAYLGRVEGFTSVYKLAEQHGLVQIMISSDDMLRFSHRVPSFKLTGDENEGVPVGSFELDPAAVPRACLTAANVKEENIRS